LAATTPRPIDTISLRDHRALGITDRAEDGAGSLGRQSTCDDRSADQDSRELKRDKIAFHTISPNPGFHFDHPDLAKYTPNCLQ
jgi:hypothetical protein